MLKDVFTVARKEMLEILVPDGRLGGGPKNVLILVGIAGLLFPLQAGRSWLNSWMSIYSACFPAILLVNYAADTFAGERERHTLETLLATRLPDLAILLGKVAAIVAFGWSLILVSQVVAVLGLSAAYGGGGLLFFSPAIAVSLVVVSLLLTLLLTSAGVVVSMTAPTVRAAGQRMIVPFIVIYGLPSLVPFAARYLNLTSALDALTPGRLVVGIAVVTAVGSGALLVVASRMFRREKLVLA